MTPLLPETITTIALFATERRRNIGFSLKSRVVDFAMEHQAEME